MVAWSTIRVNKDATERIAERLIAAGELYGDDVTDLLDECRLVKPEIDVLDEHVMARDLIPPPSPAGRPAARRRHAEPDRAAARAAALAAPSRRSGAAARRRRSSATASAS